MIVMLRAIRMWWHARQRQVDMQVLWPVCIQEAGDHDHAQAAFAYHCFNDPAWLELGEDAIVDFIDKL